MNASCVPILGILGHVIVNRHTKKTFKNTIFGLKIYYFAYNSKTTWRALLKFVHNVGDYKCFMQIKFGKLGKKRKILDRYISVNTDFDGNNLCFLSTLSTAFLLVMFVYPTEYYFSFFVFFSYFFFFSFFFFSTAIYF